MNDLSFATMWDEDDEPGINCLALNSQGALPATVDVTLGLRSIISEAYLPPTIGVLMMVVILGMIRDVWYQAEELYDEISKGNPR